MLYSDLGYLDPIHIVWRKGTDDDPYVDKSEFLRVVNQSLVLTEIPDRFTKVKISGMKEIVFERIMEKALAENEFYVEYATGVVRVHASKEAKTLNVFYKGRGFIQYPSDRIYHRDKFNNVARSLSEIIDDSNTIINEATDKIKEVQGVVDEAKKATDMSIQATDLSKIATHDANVATEKALNAYNTTRLVFKPYVSKYDDLATTYPDPEVGWTVQVYETATRYRYDGISWVPVDLFGDLIPLADEGIDGLMSKDSFQKLKSLNTKSNERVIVFAFPAYLVSGLQGVLARFPFDGEIVEIKGLCGTAGKTDTEIMVERTRDLKTWTPALFGNMIFPMDEHFDDGSHVVLPTDVRSGDIFRVNVKKLGSGIKDVTIEVKINVIELIESGKDLEAILEVSI